MEQKRPADIFQEFLDYLWNGLGLEEKGWKRLKKGDFKKKMKNGLTYQVWFDRSRYNYIDYEIGYGNVEVGFSCMPSLEEYQEALANLERVNWTVDCVLTHCAPSGVVQEINPSYGTDELTDFLEMVSQRCKFAYWFFGHYHENRIIDQKYILQWEKISELGF